ncbi:hypothetical protein ACLOJK_032480 [Asimina triloba]
MEIRTTVRRAWRVLAMSAKEAGPFSMNLNEYMVKLEKPLGIRFALSVDGKIYVHALKKGGNAEKSRIVMVGDTLKKASNSSGGGFIDIEDVSSAQNMLKENNGSFSLILERPFSPFPIHQLNLMGDYDILFNNGKVPIASWDGTILASNLQSSSEGNGHSGFAVFSPKFLRPQGWKILSDQSEQIDFHTQKRHNSVSNPLNRLVSIFSEEESTDVEWAHGSFPLEEYIKALDRAKGELYYNHSLGMQFSKALIDPQLVPDRPAIVWATWDLIAMVENGRHDGPPTHAVTFVWNHGCREGGDVYLVGDFSGNWKDSIKAVHKGGSRYEVELRLPQGKYYYKFIIDGQWKHSTALPMETDERGNVNNVIRVGDIARIRSWLPSQQIKDPTVVKVIERSLTEDERFMLAFAARRIAFSICPNRLAPKYDLPELMVCRWNIPKTRSYETPFVMEAIMHG